MGIIIGTARWRWLTRSNTSRPRSSAKITNYGEFLEKHPPAMGSADHREHCPGAASMASSAGAAIAVATAAGPAGTRNGASRCATRSIGCVMTSLRVLKRSGPTLLRDPWAARDGYIAVVLDRSPEVPRIASDRNSSRASSRRRAGDGMEADGAAAPRHAHVHQLRLVLR